MNPAIALTAARVQRSRAARDARDAMRLTPRPAAATNTNRALEAGARVFDLVTGQEGQVVYGTRENFVIQPAGRGNGGSDLGSTPDRETGAAAS